MAFTRQGHVALLFEKDDANTVAFALVPPAPWKENPADIHYRPGGALVPTMDSSDLLDSGGASHNPGPKDALCSGHNLRS